MRIRSYGKTLSVRGFQKLMNYSSPGKAQRVLSRLERIGLIEKNSSNEYIAKDLPPQLGMYVVFRGYIIPRVLIYATYATATAIVYTALAKPNMNIALLLMALIIPYWVETIKVAKIAKELLKT
ncbi:MAG: hypothetical protein QXX61_01430 [Ignisphaera sp.]